MTFLGMVFISTHTFTRSYADAFCRKISIFEYQVAANCVERWQLIEENYDWVKGATG